MAEAQKRAEFESVRVVNNQQGARFFYSRAGLVTLKPGDSYEGEVAATEIDSLRASTMLDVKPGTDGKVEATNVAGARTAAERMGVQDPQSIIDRPGDKQSRMGDEAGAAEARAADPNAPAPNLDAMDDDQLADYVAAKTGTRPRSGTSRETMLKRLE